MTDFVSLEHLLLCARPAEGVQARRGATKLSWHDWRRRVGQWYGLLRDKPGERFAVYEADAFEFSAILFGLWAAGKIASLPGSNQPVVTEQLNERVAAFIGDFPPGKGERIEAPKADASAAECEAKLDLDLDLDLEREALEIFTSGSSGEPQAIPKRLYQMAEEVANLERCFGALAGSALTVGTVSHQHIYGLLFRILWPLAAGRCFECATSDYLESLNTALDTEKGFILISSPSHLSRIPEAVDWSPFRSHCRAIFSSGAPLPREASLAARELLGHPPIEVFGSSETGGIAWRQQEPDRDVAWQLFPGMQVGRDEESSCLKLRSPYLPPPYLPQTEPQSWYMTSDRVDIEPDGRFYLRGRADRIAKVEGKRVSLTAMEKRLEAHPWLREVKVVLLKGRRTELGAVAVFSEQGQAALDKQGRRELNSHLARHLLEEFERPVLPRRWRYVAELPVDSQGKVTQGDLAALFTQVRQGRPLLPEILSSDFADDKVKLVLRIPEDLFYFQGHFAVAPILPGVVQMAWAQHYGRELLGLAGEFSHLEAIKFQHVVRPSQTVQLELGYDAAEGKLAFRYHSAAGQHASGRLVFQPVSGSPQGE